MWGRRRKTKSEVKSVSSNGDSDTERGGDLPKVTKAASGSADERIQASGTRDFSFPSQHLIETTLDREFSLQGIASMLCGSAWAEAILKDAGQVPLSRRSLSCGGGPRPAWLMFAERLTQASDLRNKY